MPGQVTGTIGQEEVRLDNAATESTLEMLVESMEKVAKGLGVKGRDYAKELKALKEEANQRKDLLDQLEEEERQRRDLNDELEKNKKKVKEFVEDLDGVVRTLTKGIDAIFAGTTPSIAGFTKAFDGIPVVGTVISTLGGVLGKQVDMYRDLARVGIRLGDDLNATSIAAARAGLPLDVFTKTLTENAASLAMFAGGAKEGAARFTEISNMMRKSKTGERLLNLGYSMEDLASHTAGYIDLQTKLGNAQGKTDAELARGTGEYMLQLDQLARVTGQNRKQIEETMLRAMNDERVKTVMNGMSAAGQKEYMSALALVSAKLPGMENAFKELVATGGQVTKGMSKEAKSLALLHPEIARQAGAFKRNQGSVAEFASAVRTGAMQVKELGDGTNDLAATLSVNGGNIGTSGNYMLMGAENFGKALDQATLDQQKDADNKKLAALTFDSAMTKIRNAFVEAFIKTGILDKFATGLSNIITVIGKFIQDVQKFDFSTALANLLNPKGAVAVDPDTGKEIIDAKTGEPVRLQQDLSSVLLPALGEGITSLFTSGTTYAVLGGAITALFAASVVKKALIDSFTNLVGSAARRLTVGTAATTVAGGAGAAGTAGAGAATASAKSAGGFAKGLLATMKAAGTGLSLVLQGLATGLKAFANPQALVGLGAVTLAIMGLSKAFEIASRGFEPFGNMVKSILEGITPVVEAFGTSFSRVFESIGTAVSNAKAGIEAVFNGISTVVSTIGDKIIGVITSISNGIGNVIGKISEYKTAGINATTDQIERITNIKGDTLQSAAAGVEALKRALAGLNPGLFEGIGTGLGKMFAGDQAKSLEQIAKTAPNLKMLGDALKDINFEKLDTSRINFDSFSIGAKKVNELTTALSAVNRQMKEITKTTVAEDLKTAFDKVTASIEAIIKPDTSPSSPAVRQAQLLTDINTKLETLNTSMTNLVGIQEDAKSGINTTAKWSKKNRTTL